MVNGIRLRIKNRGKIKIKKYDDNMNLSIYIESKIFIMLRRRNIYI